MHTPYVLRRLCAAALLLSSVLTCGAAGAQASPVGLWRTVDDNTGKTQALVRISESNGELSGRIEKLFPDAGEDPNPRCNKCDGPRKDQPVLGMTILTGLKRGHDADEYTGGDILDPENGNVYRALLTLVENGKKLKVRGYLGVTIFGRTQVWERAD